MPGRKQIPSFQIASGTTAERDGSYNLTTVGNIFYNTDTSNVEVYVPDNTGNSWFHLNLNNSFEITVANLSRPNPGDHRYDTDDVNPYPGIIGAALYNQKVNHNTWTQVNFDTVIEGRRSGVDWGDLLINNEIIIPFDGKYNFDFGCSAGWLGSSASHGTGWKYYVQFVVTTTPTGNVQYYNTYPYGSRIDGTDGVRANALIHDTTHQYIASGTHFQPVFMNKGDKVKVNINHNRNSHTLLGTDEKGRLGGTYNANSTGNSDYNYEYIKKIAPRFTITRVS